MNSLYIKKTLPIIFIFISCTTLFSQSAWTQKANFGGAVRREATGFSIGNKGYLGTGVEFVGFNLIIHKDFWEYDQANGTWSQKADFGGTGRIAAVGFSIGGKGYIGTGADTNGYRNDLWEYDTTGNTWTQKANLSGSGRYYAIGISIGNKGYVGTGRDTTGQYTNDWWEYDPSTNSWLQKTNFPGTPREHPIGFSIGTKGYVGTGTNANLENDFYEYNSTTGVWTQKANYAGPPSEGGVAFTIGTKGYVATGYDGGFMKALWEYNPSNNSWAQKSDFPAIGRHGAVGFSIGAKGYVGTGDNVGLTFYNDFWEYDPSLDAIPVFYAPFHVSVFPSPMHENAMLEISGIDLSKNVKFKLYNCNGKLVREMQVETNSMLIDGNNWSAGIYIYQISSEQETIATGKLMVE